MEALEYVDGVKVKSYCPCLMDLVGIFVGMSAPRVTGLHTKKIDLNALAV